MDISFSMRAVVPEDVLMRDLEGEAVLLNLQSERYFGLDKVGTRMWHLLTTAASIQTAYDALLAEYDVEPEKLRQDLQDLVANLVEQGLLEVTGG